MGKSIKERYLENMAKLEKAPPPSANTSVGTIITPNSTDNSFKISGGALLISNNSRLKNPSVAVPERLRNRNRETLVRTVF